ncbi:MAG TPA: hypothetical protein VN616_07385 [Puia sp.]|nr:hypothetical protein [Puia sp.]
MSKIKMLFLAAGLMLVTAGVFAGKAKFQTISNLYVSSNGTTFFPLATSVTPGDIQTTINGAQITIEDHSGVSYKLYYGMSSLDKVYSTNAW